MTRSAEPTKERTVSGRVRRGVRLTSGQDGRTANKSKAEFAHIAIARMWAAYLTNLAEKALSLVSIRPYRCRECRHRFWKIN